VLSQRWAMRGRLAATVAVTAVAAGAAPAAALAYSTGFRFTQDEDGTANISAEVAPSGPPTAHHLELVRGGVVIATSPAGPPSSFASLDAANLLAGDIARFYDDGAVRAIASYDGLPAISADACAGRTAFSGTRSSDQVLVKAGAFTPNSGYGVDNRAIFTSGNPFTVTLTRPLAVRDVAFAVTQGLQSSGDVGVESQRYVNVGACPPAPVPPVQPGGSSAAPTDAQVLAKLKTALAAAARRLKAQTTAKLARRRSIALPFAFSEPGTVKLTISAPSTKKNAKAVTVGSGAKTAATAGTIPVTVRLTAAGRKLLKRARKLTLTLKGTFAPARAGAKTQAASTRATLKRK
jgi:hypothetical protein